MQLTLPSYPRAGFLTGRRALVTGGGNGIGRATCLRLAADGAAVAVMDYQGESADAVAGHILDAGGRALALQGDVSNEASISKLVEHAVDDLGGLDTLVTCAGIVASGRTHTTSLDHWELVIRVNLTGTFLSMKHCLPNLIDAGGGSIVTIGSVAALVAAGSTSSYSASKGAVVQLTRTVAVEYADDNVRANCVCPGRVLTDLPGSTRTFDSSLVEGRKTNPALGRVAAPQDRRADPSELAAAICFLCSDEASFITGAVIPVDGGYTAI